MFCLPLLRVPTRITPLALSVCLSGFLATPAHAAKEWTSDQFTNPAFYESVFGPFETDVAALSPDGERIAYSRRVGETLWVTIVRADDPATILTQVQVGADTSSTPVLEIQSRERVPARIEWMGWATDERLVLQTNQISLHSVVRHTQTEDVPDPTAELDGLTSNRYQTPGRIFAVDADGQNGRVIGEPHGLGRLEDQTEANRRAESSRKLLDVDEFFLEQEKRMEQSSRIPSTMLVRPLAAPEAADVPPPMTVLPRRPTIVGFSPDNEKEIWVQAGPTEDYDLFAINVFNGKKRLLRTERVVDGRTALPDRQHRLRLALPSSTLSTPPFRFLYDTGRALFPWKPLQEVLANGVQADFTLSGTNILGGRSFPLGFDENPDILYFGSDVGRENIGVYALQLSSGRLTDLAIEHPIFDIAAPAFLQFQGAENLVYDRYSRRFLGIRYNTLKRTTAWLREDWNQLQNHLEAAFPDRSVEILDWNRDRTRFLLRTSSPTRPGEFHLYDSASSQISEFARRAPALDEAEDAWSIDFVFERPDLPPTVGRMTVPARPVDQPIPVIILCRSQFWESLQPEFDRRAVALARMGFAVAQYTGRGGWGLGRSNRLAIARDYDDGQAAEIVALVDFLAERFGIDPEKVALMGEDLGGYLALRTLQEYPERFRGAIAINAPFNLDEWVEKARWGQYDEELPDTRMELIRPWLGDTERLARAPLVKRTDTLRKPVQLFAFRRFDGNAFTPDFNHAHSLARRLRDGGIPVELNDLHRDYLRGLPKAQSEVYAQIAAFLNTHLFDYWTGMEDMEVELELSEAR